MKILASETAYLQDLLTDSVMSQIYSAGRIKKFRDRELIQQRGDSHAAISILKKGLIVAGNYGVDGSFFVSAMLQPGECFGEFTLFAELPRTHDLTAVGSVEVLEIKKTAFFNLMDKEPQISRALLFITLRRSHLLLEFLDNQRRLSLTARVAKLIAQMMGQQSRGDKANLVIHCRQEEIAFILGVTRVSISNELKKLAQLHLIKTGYGKIEIINLDNLSSWLEKENLVVPVAGLKYNSLVQN